METGCFLRLVQDEELRARHFMQNQITDQNSAQFGGFVEDGRYWCQPKSTLYRLTTLLSLYHTPQSCFFHDAAARESIAAGLDYAARFQRENGTFDYLDCNFASAPDTAFCVKRLLPSFRCLQKSHSAPGDREALEKMREILRKAADGIEAGGFHTPNHRWAIASVLMACANIFQEPKYREKAQRYLGEGVDCNRYGEYAERSSGNYNRICDDAMILLYEETGDRAFLDCARRNLKMMLYYFEPDGSIFTKNSTRYDSRTKFYPDNYYFDYLYLSFLCREPEFAAASNRILSGIVRRGGNMPDCLPLLMSHPQLLDYEPKGCGFPAQYRFFNPESGIVRVRRGNLSETVLSRNPHFLWFRVGALSVSVRLGLIFFDRRNFEPDGIARDQNGGFRLEQKMKGWFYQPFRRKPKSSDWGKMDHGSREILPGPELKITVQIAEDPDGISLRFHTAGCDRVPFQIELEVETGCFIRADGFLCESVRGGRMVVRSGDVEITKGPDSIRIGPGFGSHFYIGGKDGEAESGEGRYLLSFTGFTNTDRLLRFRRVERRFSEKSGL